MIRSRIDFSDIQWQSLVLCGVSVQTAAIFTAYYRPIQMDAALVTSSVTSPASLVFSLTLALLLIVLGMTSRFVERLVERPGALLAAAALFAGASLIGSSLVPDSIASMGADLIARTASAFLMLGWLRLFANFDSDTVLQTLPAIMAFGLAVIMASVAAGPRLRLTCLVLLTMVAALWLIFAGRATRIPLTNGADASQDTSKRLRHEGLVCLAAFFLSALLGVLCALPFHKDSGPESPFFLYFLLMMGVALLLLAFMALLRKGTPLGRVALVARVVAPLALAVLCAAVGAAIQPPFDPLVNAVGRMSMELSLIICFLLAARHFSLSLIRTSAFGQAAFLAGNSLGMFLGLGIPRLLDVQGDDLLIASVVILLLTTEALFVLVVLYQFSRRLSSRAAAEAAIEEPAATIPEPSAGLEAFASTFRLSEKESEVLRLTVRGRSRQRIAEALYVSPGTVNTYFYRIYQKVGVHTRQELLDKVEELSNEGN